jgi:Chemoreceptor zinc-binding domain
MNFFDDQVMHYSGWIDKLKAYAKKPDGSLQAADIRPDDRCALGHWIDEERPRLAPTPEYATLQDVHARFHAAAADVVVTADGEGPAAAQAALEGTELKRTFAHLIKALVMMKSRAS